MIFANTFLGSKPCSNYTATNVAPIKTVTIQNGIFDEMYITSNTDLVYSTEIPSDWDFDTILHALFQGTLHAGNVDYTVSNVSSIRIKRREMGTFDWITVFDIPIKKIDDFTFERRDLVARSKTWYEYALVPVTNNVEGNFNINKVYSDFDGTFIVGCNDDIFSTYMNMALSIQNNKPTSTVTTLGRKYPFVVTAGKSNYVSGTLTGTFADFDRETCELNLENGQKHRRKLMDFLMDGQPKIIKIHDSRMWLCSIVGNPSENSANHPDMPITTIEFVETGDADSGKDLYQNGFIDAVNGR